MATLRVGAGETFASIQAAVDNANAGDEIEISDGQYVESVNLSRMGSAFNGAAGNLAIRGLGPDVQILSPSGPAFFNSASFNGNVIFDSLTLSASDGSTGEDHGIEIDDFSGILDIGNVRVESTNDSAISIANFEGELRIVDNDIDRTGTGTNDHGIRLEQVTGKVTVVGNVIQDVSGDGIVMTLTGGGEVVALIAENAISGDRDGFTTTQGGIRLQASGNSQMDAVVVDNVLEDLNRSAISVLVEGAAQFQGRIDVNVIFNLNEAAATAFRVEESAQAAFSYTQNLVTDTLGDGLHIGMGNQARINAVIEENIFTDADDVPGKRGAVVTADQDASAIINLLFKFNNFVGWDEAGTLVEGNGGSTYNLTFIENTYFEVNLQAGEAAVEFAKISDSTSAAFNVDFVGNGVFESQEGDFLFVQRGSGPFRLTGDEADAKTQVEETNIGTAELDGSVTLVSPGLFDETVPLRLGDQIWNDANGDGVFQSALEDGLTSVVVSITGTETSSGELIGRSTISDLTGNYQFSGLLPGTYDVRVEPFLGFSLVAPNQGDDPTVDSDFDPSTRSTTVTLLKTIDDWDVDGGLARNWQNPIEPVDVNDDQIVAPVDALIIINDLNASGARLLPLPPAPPNEPPPYLDVNGDSFVAPVDVLQIINFLNSNGSGEGEGPNGSRPTEFPAASVSDLSPPSGTDATPSSASPGTRRTSLVVPAVSAAVLVPSAGSVTKHNFTPAIPPRGDSLESRNVRPAPPPRPLQPPANGTRPSATVNDPSGDSPVRPSEAPLDWLNQDWDNVLSLLSEDPTRRTH